MRNLPVIGRIIVGLFYLYPAYENIFMANMKVGYAASKGVPMPELLVPLSGLLLLIGGLSLLTGYQPKLGITAILLFLLPVTLTMHNFWAIQDPMMWMVEFHSFLANVGLAGSALMFLAIPEPWKASVTLNRRFAIKLANAKASLLTLLFLVLCVSFFSFSSSTTPSTNHIAIGMPALDAASKDALSSGHGSPCHVRADYCGDGT